MLVLSQIAMPVYAQEKPVTANNWAKPFFTRLDITFSESAFHARWDVSRCECGDVYIIAEETLPDEIREGSQLLLNSEVLLVSGYKNYEGPLAALLDSPMLMTQLLFVLLQHSAPSGPVSVVKTLQPDVEKLKTPLLLDSGLAYGAFPAPWKLGGTITPLNTGQFRFELEFTFGLQDAGEQKMRLSGLLDYNKRDFPIGNSTVLDGWSAAWLNLKTENHNGITPGLTLGEFKKTMGSE
jgi:hypothetical protein